MDILDLQEDVLDAYDGLEDIPSIEDPSIKAMTQKTWLGRMVNEYGSSQVFEAFAKQCSHYATELNLSDESIHRLHEFALEEKRHGILCGAVVEAFAHRGAHGWALDEQRVSVDECSERLHPARANLRRWIGKGHLHAA